MMGHRLRMINGDEYAALTRRGRRVHRFKTGRRASIKRRHRRRERHGVRTCLISQSYTA